MAYKKNYTKKTKEQYVKQAMEKLVESVKKMSREEYKKYLKNISRNHPHNYSINNTAMFTAQLFDKKGIYPTVVGGAKSFWASVNRRVKKDEYGKNGLWILLPVMGSFDKEEIDEKGNKIKQNIKYVKTFRYGKVYDLSQTEGEDYVSKIHNRVVEDEWDLDLEGLISFLNKKASLGISIERKEDQPSLGGYVTPTGYVRLNSLRSMSDNKSTLVHELAHWFMGHTAKTCTLSREQKETDAETVAFCIGQRFGIVAESVQYVFGWSDGGKVVPNFEAIFSAFKKIDGLINDFLEASGSLKEAVNE